MTRTIALAAAAVATLAPAVPSAASATPRAPSRAFVKAPSIAAPSISRSRPRGGVRARAAGYGPSAWFVGTCNGATTLNVGTYGAFAHLNSNLAGGDTY